MLEDEGRAIYILFLGEIRSDAHKKLTLYAGNGEPICVAYSKNSVTLSPELWPTMILAQ